MSSGNYIPTPMKSIKEAGCGYLGPTALKVLVIISLAWRRGKIVSVDELCRMTNRTREAIHTATNKLIAAGLASRAYGNGRTLSRTLRPTCTIEIPPEKVKGHYRFVQVEQKEKKPCQPSTFVIDQA